MCTGFLADGVLHSVSRIEIKSFAQTIWKWPYKKSAYIRLNELNFPFKMLNDMTWHQNDFFLLVLCINVHWETNVEKKRAVTSFDMKTLQPYNALLVN